MSSYFTTCYLFDEKLIISSHQQKTNIATKENWKSSLVENSMKLAHPVICFYKIRALI